MKINSNLVVGIVLYLGAVLSFVFLDDGYGTATRLSILCVILGSVFMFFAYLSRQKKEKK